MESIIGFIVFAVVAAGMGYFVYNRIMKKKAKAAPPHPAPVEPPKET